MREIGGIAAVAMLILSVNAARAQGPQNVLRFDKIIRSADFLDTIGVNTHLSYNDGAYSDIHKVIANLRYLGITHIRDGLIAPGVSGSPTIDTYVTVARMGFKFTLVISGGGAVQKTGGIAANPSLDQRIGFIDFLVQAVPGSVAAVEGTNEINNFPVTYAGLGDSGGGDDELGAGLALQRDLYAMIHADRQLDGVPVDYLTGYAAGSIPVGPDPAKTGGLADFNTQHPYPNFGQPPRHWVSREVALTNQPQAKQAKPAPAVYTETGYSSNGGTTGAVSPDVQAKYTLDLLLDAAKNSISATYLYELLDAYPPESRQGDAGFGLFDHQGNPKPVAAALRNLRIILDDTGTNASTFQPTPIDVHVTGTDDASAILQLQKSDGTSVIALWNEQPIWDSATAQQLAPRHHAERVVIGSGPASFDITEYAPLRSADAVQHWKSEAAVTIDLADEVILLVVTPSPPR